MPHAIVLESSDGAKSLELAKFISMYAVCGDANRPCGKCGQCHRAANRAHADIKYAYPEKKSKTYSIDQMRDIITRQTQRCMCLRMQKTGLRLWYKTLF